MQYRAEWMSNLCLDDQLWHQSLVTLRRLDEQQRNQEMPYYDRTFFKMIRKGVIDQTFYDRPWDASTRSMRYSAALSDRLWEMIRFEREKVRIASGLS